MYLSMSGGTSHLTPPMQLEARFMRLPYTVSFTSCIISRTSMTCMNSDLKPMMWAWMAVLNRCEATRLISSASTRR